MANPTIIPGWTGLVSEDVPSELTPGGGQFLLVRQDVGILNAQCKTPRPVRLTLKPLQRFDRAPVFPLGTAYPGMRAGFNAAVLPPPNVIATGSRTTGQANYALVTWGSGGARQHALLSDWPVSGASIELTADNVQVVGVCGETPGLAVTAAQAESRPRFAADLSDTAGRGRGQYDGLSFSQLIFGAIVTGTTRQLAVPEFAKAVMITLGDALAQNVFELSWMDPFGQVVEVARFGLSGAANGNLALPAWVPVPDGAVAMIFTAITFGTLNTTGWAHWRIAP